MSVSKNNFALSLIPNTYVEHIKKNGYNYFAIPHLSEYKIKLTNGNQARCDAEISIDGEPIGTWRIVGLSSIIVERPANINRKFVFRDDKYYLDVSRYSRVPKKNTLNGVVSVVFKPENYTMCPYASVGFIVAPTYFERDQVTYSDSLPVSDVYNNYSPYFGSSGSPLQVSERVLHDDMPYSGETILGGGTDQNFTATGKLRNVDHDKITKISIRLIPSKARPYISIRDANLNKPFLDRVGGDIVYEVRDRYADSDKIMIEKPFFQ